MKKNLMMIIWRRGLEICEKYRKCLPWNVPRGWFRSITLDKQTVFIVPMPCGVAMQGVNCPLNGRSTSSCCLDSGWPPIEGWRMVIMQQQQNSPICRIPNTQPTLAWHFWARCHRSRFPLLFYIPNSLFSKRTKCIKRDICYLHRPAHQHRDHCGST